MPPQVADPTASILLQNIAFYTIAALGLLSAAGMLLVRNLIHSAYLLVLTFVCVAATFFLLNAEFLAVAQLMIYATAVAIMVIFGLMLTHRPAAPMASHSVLFRYVSLAIAVALYSYAVRLALVAPWRTVEMPPADATALIGKAFFSTYLLPFEIAAILLLGALIGALTMARKEA